MTKAHGGASMSKSLSQKVYSKTHYDKNKPYYLDKAKRRKELVRDFIREAKNKPCADCNKTFPYYVMQFDHVRGNKVLSIGNVTSRGLSIIKLKSEIKKCDVVCANCHADRTHKRAKAMEGNKVKSKVKQQIEMFTNLFK